MVDSNLPEVGDVLKVEIEWIKDNGKCVALLPSSIGGPKHITINDRTIHSGETTYIEITDGGHRSCGHFEHYKAKTVAPPEESDESDDDSSVLGEYTAERVEWDGTEQDIESAQERENDGFADPRDNKNDLLDGHL